ncbi:MAG: 30S ribosomal protein S4 [Clostridia bacterium]|jgi:small subunit ribosomal protein S4|nr:30S ribosomal protein S4 [Clostridia bacterium]MCI2000630.1 30S ribosomal protein S4 [Clostridia bacterium]MCI2015297.1 30S ribosomal protein S4 [Clostridia bacterium]
MARDMVPVLKRCRSLDLDPVFLGIAKKSKKQPANSRRKISEYGLQMREKQKAKFIYGVLERQFRGYYAKAVKMSKKEGIPGENLLMLLELRLDNALFRLGYGRTRKEARQIVRHKHITVNGKPVDIPSYQLKVGDVVAVKDKFATAQRYKDILEVTGSRIVPEWLTADHEKLSGTVVARPTRAQIDVPVEDTLIVELYSK